MPRRIATALLTAAVTVILPATALASPTVTQFSTGYNETAAPVGIVSGPDGNLWLASGGAKAVYSMTLAGGFSSHETNGKLGSVAVGPDGKVWFTESEGTTEIGNVDPGSGLVNQYAVTG